MTKKRTRPPRYTIDAAADGYRLDRDGSHVEVVDVRTDAVEAQHRFPGDLRIAVLHLSLLRRGYRAGRHAERMRPSQH